MTNTRPVPSTSAKMVDKGGFLISPWIQFFQQFVQKAAAVVAITPTGSPFSYTPNQNGSLIITGGTVSSIVLQRGTVNITVATATSAATKPIIPISVGDTVIVTYSVKPTIQFLGS